MNATATTDPAARQVLDTRRHQTLFDPYEFIAAGHRITLSGAGPVGSRLGRLLAQLGVPFDVFDPSNVDRDFRGAYARSDWNATRVEALQRMLERDTGVRITGYKRNLDDSDVLGNIVFHTTSDLKRRRKLCSRLERSPKGVDLVVDIKADDTQGEMRFWEPRFSWQLPGYRKSLEKNAWSGGNHLTLPTTAGHAASVAAVALMRWFANWKKLRALTEPTDRLGPKVKLSSRIGSGNIAAARQFAADFGRSGLSVTIIGGGALGSRTAQHLAALGISFAILDFDTVESHNLPNQAFGFGEIGQLKAEAVSRIVHRDFANAVGMPQATPRIGKFDGSQPLGNIVFVCPDNMPCRQLVWNTVRLSEQTELVVEGRMGAFWGKVYTAITRSPKDLREYEKTLYLGDTPDEEPPQPGVCRAVTSVGPTAECIASRMVWQLIRWFVNGRNSDSLIDHEIFEYLRPHELHLRNFT